jgi:autotransporter-associated beta strand protein
LSIPGAISGTGSVTNVGPGTVTLGSAANTYLGPTTISNGTVVVGSLGGGDLNVEGGTIIVRGTGSIGNANVGTMNIDAGTVVASLNKAQSPSNTTYTATAVNYTGGMLKLYLAGAGPVLAPGDKFTIFSQPVTGGGAMPIVSPGFTVNNNLAVDGSVTIATVVTPYPPSLTPSVSGGSLTLTWPAAWTGGVHLQGQTNRFTNGFALGLTNTWVNIAGSDLVNSFTTPIAKTNGSVFYRLVIP